MQDYIDDRLEHIEAVAKQFREHPFSEHRELGAALTSIFEVLNTLRALYVPYEEDRTVAKPLRQSSGL
ncbi:MAG: hypothetical protein EBU90_26235 [Proteobacteria bacterium]|nr:hypothetical protein [Pseudomonadota bacterium]